MDFDQKEQTEIKFWQNTTFSDSGDPFQSISMTGWPTIINRMVEAQVFIEKLHAFDRFFGPAKTVLELGGGQCWASCMVKVANPSAHVTGTDIAPSAVDAIPIWERIFNVKLDRSLACKSYDTGLSAGSFDLIFAFSSAHHFGRYRQTLREISRLLKPDGAVLFLHEPACPPIWYPLAKWRMDRRSYGVPEDVLLTGKLRKFSAEFGMTTDVIMAPTLTSGGPIQSIYYLGLKTVPLLQRVMPCSVDLLFRRGGGY